MGGKEWIELGPLGSGWPPSLWGQDPEARCGGGIMGNGAGNGTDPALNYLLSSG